MSTTFVPDTGWLSYDPHPSKPSWVLPSGAVDAHCHVFGPGHLLPYAAERKYTPTDAGKGALFELRDFLGFDKNVIVQATCHGADNRALVDALQAASGRARGVATVRPDVSDETLGQLDDAGVQLVRRGAGRPSAATDRADLHGRPHPPFQPLAPVDPQQDHRR